ncbi:hypothetical protein ACOMHN_063046 [Nucella lapillus]
MGSSPESVRFLLQQLQCRPQTICWSQPRPVLLHRGHNHKLGFHFKTFSYPESWETVTVVVRVKEDCGVGAGRWLQVGDRILTVGAVPLTCLREEEVKHVFTCSQNPDVHLQVCAMAMSRATTDPNSQNPDVHLQVCAMAMSRATTDPNSQVKRFLSVNSGASGGSGTASVDSTERPKYRLSPPSSSFSSSFSATLSLLRCAGPGPQVEPETPPPPPPSRRRQQAPRECATYKRPGYPLHSAPHLNPQPQYHSLPDRMEDDIILPDDIILCEADTPSSLPPVLTRLPNTPTPSSSASFSSSLHSQYPGAAFVNTVSTGIGGESVVGSSSASSQQQQQQQRSLGVEVCRAPGCNTQRLCLWHRFVMMHPQFVIWEPFTKTVVLEKHHGKQASFGFKYKVKKHDGPPEEVFALVTEVTMGGLAWNLLLAGDWIRSLNGTPVNTAKEAFSPDFRSLSSLRLVIQRPEGLSWKGVPKLKALAQSSGISLHIPIPVPLEAASAAAPQPADNARPPPPPPPADHRFKYLDRHAAPGSEEGGGSCRVGAREPNCQHRHRASFDDPLLEQYPRLGQSPGEHIPLNTLLSRPVPSCGGEQSAFPQARVVVCGAHGSAAAFVRGLVGDGVDLESDAPVQSFQLSLQRGGGGGGGGADADISVSSQRRQLTALINDWESLTCHAGEREGQGEGGRCMNLELHAISDEGFFHHCCPWLLPSCTLVIFTFHVHKLLNQPQAETRRLAAMVCSMQDASHPSEASALKIRLYGMPSGPQRDVLAEEIQGMFYVTDSGSRLLERYGLAVNVTVPSCGRSMAATRREVFAACQDHLVQTAASSQCVLARVVDSLSAGGHWGVKVSGREVARVVVGEGGDAEMVRSVIGGLVETGSLLVCGSTSSSNRPGKKPEEVGAEHQDYLLPFSAVQALASFLVKPLLDNHTPDSRQKWFKLITTARLTRAELAELLDSETSSSLSVEVLERLGVAFRLCSASPGVRGDSGFGEDSAAAAAGGDFVLPYFLQDEEGGGGGGGEEGEREGGERFVMRFERPLSWRGYFDMLCKLSALPATEEVVVPGHCRAGVRHNGLRLALHWRKDSGCNGVFVAVKRSSRSREGGQLLPELERLFSFVLPPAVPFKVQVADCSSPSSHLPSRDGPPALRSAAAMHEEETFVKPVVPVETEWRSLQMGDAACRDLPLTSLPWSVLNQAAILLSVGMPTGHDWRSVAELTGKSMVEIYAYEAISSVAREVPAMTFLREWMLTGKVQQFLDILETLERPDVRDLILNHLRDRAN